MNQLKYETILKNQDYMLNMRPVFRKDALYSDGSEDFVSPSEPEPYDVVTIRFRAAKNNVDAVYLIHEDKRYFMEKEGTKGKFDYYKKEIRLSNEVFRYQFEVFAGKVTCFYNQYGATKELMDCYHFCIAPGFSTPDWAKGAVMYQIFVDRFYNGDPANDVEDKEYIYIQENTVKVTDWNKYPASMGVREFYGGDLQGVLEKLDYLQDLGVEVIYFNPIFVSPSNHKYDIQDYDYIDPHYGKIVNDEGELLKDGDRDNKHATRYITRVTNKENLEASNQLFIKLTEEIHKRGMKVILDGVFNHCGSFNKFMDRERIYENAEGYEKGAYVSADSPYRTFFDFKGGSWPYNHVYDGWWGHDTLPKLNYEDSEKLREYIFGIAKKWVSYPYCADGWRLDVAADLGHSNAYNHEFWKEFRRVVKEANPNAIILAEHYGNPKEWLKGDEWDTVMNYDAFMEPLTWFLTGMEKHSDEYREDLYGNADCFDGAVRHHISNFMNSSMLVAMNELSNHDHSRFLTRTNHLPGRVADKGPEAAERGVNKAVFREAVLFQMTWPGAPTIYYGDEAGVCGFTDPDNRRTYPWGKEDLELIRFHKEMIALRKQFEVFRTGSVIFLGGAYQTLAFGRFNKKEQFIIVLNNLDKYREVTVPVWRAEVEENAVLKCLMQTDADGFGENGRCYTQTDGELIMQMPPFSAMVLQAVPAENN